MQQCVGIFAPNDPTLTRTSGVMMLVVAAAAGGGGDWMMMTMMLLLIVGRSWTRVIAVAIGALQATWWLDKAETGKKAHFDKELLNLLRIKSNGPGP
jgi:hypothetical protein